MQSTPDGATVATLILACITFLLVCVTFLVVLGTSWLAIEARTTRVQTEKQEGEIAFRAALSELADDIGNFERWNPTIAGHRPDELWFSRPLRFVNLDKLLETVWVNPHLWIRILAVRRHIESQCIEYRESANGLTEGFTNLTNEFHIIDLYLKQLAQYIISEARVHGFKANVDTVANATSIFKPLPWNYGIAGVLEVHLTLPPEPSGAAYTGCTLEVLTNQALVAAERQGREVMDSLS